MKGVEVIAEFLNLPNWQIIKSVLKYSLITIFVLFGVLLLTEGVLELNEAMSLRCTYTEKSGIVDFYDCGDLPAILAKYKAEHPELELKQMTYKPFGRGLVANFEPN